jgi:hypothetical protein
MLLRLHLYCICITRKYLNIFSQVEEVNELKHVPLGRLTFNSQSNRISKHFIESEL